MSYREERDNELIDYFSQGYDVLFESDDIVYVIDAPCDDCEKIGWLNKSSENGWLCESCWSIREIEL